MNCMFSSPIGAFLFLTYIIGYHEINCGMFGFSSPIGAFLFLTLMVSGIMITKNRLFSSPIGAFLFLTNIAGSTDIK